MPDWHETRLLVVHDGCKAARGQARDHLDRERIFHVLLDLIGNAIRFTPAGAPLTSSARAS